MSRRRVDVLLTVLAVTVVGSVALPRSALAQSAADRFAEALVRDALDAYQNLDADGAAQRLRSATSRCGRRNCSAYVMASVSMAQGVVAVGAQNDPAAGERAFAAALALEPEIALDPVLATPEITASLARARRGQRHGAAQHLLHTPVVEQLERTPIPIYVETPSGELHGADVFYRAQGVVAWSRVAMDHVAHGWGGQIPCAGVRTPAIEYYVWGYDDHAVPIAEAGTDGTPYHVDVVTQRTRPTPSIPGQLPPEQCGQASSSAPPCSETDPCPDGRACHEGACAEPSALPASPAPTSAEQPIRLAVDVGSGVGFAAVGGQPGYAEAIAIDPTMPNGPAACVNVSCPASPSGVSVLPYLWFAARYNVTSRIAAATSVRWQPDSSARTRLSSVLLSLRGYYAFLDRGWNRMGLSAAAFLGLGVGQIQARPPSPSADMPSATTGHIVTGLNNIHLGARAEYGFSRYVHAAAELTLQFEFPRFLFDVDLTLLVGAHY